MQLKDVDETFGTRFMGYTWLERKGMEPERGRPSVLEKLKNVPEPERLPNLVLKEESREPLGKYGRMRRAFLKEHRPILYNDLCLTEQLFPHLREIDETAHQRLERIMDQLLEKHPAPDRKTQPMAWVQHMNSLKAQAEETILAELINS